MHFHIMFDPLHGISMKFEDYKSNHALPLTNMNNFLPRNIWLEYVSQIHGKSDSNIVLSSMMQSRK